MSSELQMASENYKKTSCESDPNFAVICAFLEKFGVSCGLSNIDFMSLQGMLENTEEVSQTLIDLHIKLLRRAKKSIKNEKWEKEIIKFCYRFSCQDAWEIEKSGYMKAKLSTKIRILKELLEVQFDCNNRFKTEINKMSASELRSQPLGRDRVGYTYWFLNDCNYQIRVYKEDPENETWTLVARDKDSLLALIAELNGEEFKSTRILNDDKNDHSLSEKASPEAEQKKTGDWFIKAEEKENRLILSLKESPSNSKETDHTPEKSHISGIPEDVMEPQSDISEQEPKLRLKKEADLKESSITGTVDSSEDHSNETKIGKVRLKNVSSRISELNEVTNRTLATSEGDHGRSSGDVADLQANPVISETIEEAVLYIHGEGSGQDNLTGNEDMSGSSDLKQENSSSVHTKIQTLEDSDKSGYSDPVCSSGEISDHTCMQLDVLTSAGSFSKLGKVLDTKTGIKTNFLKSVWKKSRWDVENSQSSDSMIIGSDATVQVSEDSSVGSVKERINEWEQLPTSENNFSSQVVGVDGNDHKLSSTDSSNIQSKDEVQHVNKESTDRNSVVHQRNKANVTEEIQGSPSECSMPIIDENRKLENFMSENADHFSPNNILEIKADVKNDLVDNASIETVTTSEDQVSESTPHSQSARETKTNQALKVQDDEKSETEEILQEESVPSSGQSNSCPDDENSIPSKLRIESQNNTVQCGIDGDVYEIVGNKKSFEIDSSLEEFSVNQTHVVDTVGCNTTLSESKLNSTGFQSVVDTKKSSGNEFSSTTDENNKKSSATVVNQLPLDSITNYSPAAADVMAVVDASIQHHDASVGESLCSELSPSFSKLPASDVQSTNLSLDCTTINKNLEKAVSCESLNNKELPFKDAGSISDGLPVKMKNVCSLSVDQVHLSSELSLDSVPSSNVSSVTVLSKDANKSTSGKSKSDTESKHDLSPLSGSSTGTDDDKESLGSQVHHENDPECTNQVDIPIGNTSVDNNDEPADNVLYRSKISDDSAFTYESSDIIHDDKSPKSSAFGNETTTTNKEQIHSLELDKSSESIHTSNVPTGLIYHKDSNNDLPVSESSNNHPAGTNKIDAVEVDDPDNHPAGTNEKDAVEVDDLVVKTLNLDSDHVHTSIEATDRIHIACASPAMISTDEFSLKTSDNTSENSENKVETSLKKEIGETCEMSVSGELTKEKPAVEVVNDVVQSTFVENEKMLDSSLAENISVTSQESINSNAEILPDKVPYKNASSDNHALCVLPDIEKHHNLTVSDVRENYLNEIKVISETSENSTDDTCTHTSRNHNTELYKSDGNAVNDDKMHTQVEQTVESVCSNDIIKSVTNIENPKNDLGETESSGENTISSEASVLKVTQNEIINEDNEISNGLESNTLREANMSDNSLGKQHKTNDTVKEEGDVECNEEVGGNEEKQLDKISNKHKVDAELKCDIAMIDRSIEECNDVNNDIPKTTASVMSHKLDCEKSQKSEPVSSISITKTDPVNETHTDGKTKENPNGFTEGDDQIDTASYKKEENYESQISPGASSKSQVEEDVHSEQIEQLEKSTDGKDKHLEQIYSDEKPAQTSEHNKSEQDMKDKVKENVEPPSTISTVEKKCEITAVAVSNEIISPDVEKYVEDSSDNNLSKIISGFDQEVSRRVTRRSGGNFMIQGMNKNEKPTKKVPERGIKQQTKSTNVQGQRELSKVCNTKQKTKKLKDKHVDISTNVFDPVVMITRTTVNKNRKTKSVTPETKVLTRSSSRSLDKRFSDTELGGTFEKNSYVDTTDCSTRVKKAIKYPVKKKMGDEITDSLKDISEKPNGEKKSRSQDLNKGGNILIEAEEFSENTRTLRGNKRMSNMNTKDIKSESPFAKKQKVCDDSKIMETRITRSNRHFVEMHLEHKDEVKFPLVSRNTKTSSCKTSKTSVNKNTRSSQSSSISTPILLPQVVPIIDCDAAVDSSSDVIEILERDPLAVSEGESEVSRQSGNLLAPSMRRSLRKRGLEHPENASDLSESSVKKNKAKSKESASLHLEKSFEKAQNTVNISSSEDDVIIISDSNETLKIGPKKKSPSKKSKKKKGLQNRTSTAPDRGNLASHNPQPTKKQIVENRNSKCKH